MIILKIPRNKKDKLELAIKSLLKWLFTDFTWGINETVSTSRPIGPIHSTVAAKGIEKKEKT